MRASGLDSLAGRVRTEAACEAPRRLEGPKMRPVVLVLVKGLGIGGAEKLLSEGARFWDRDRFEYHVAYVLPWKDQLVGAFGEFDVPVHLLSESGRSTPALVWRLRRLVRGIGADLVHAHLPHTGILARIGAGVPVVYTEHNLAGSYRGPTRLANKATYGANAVAIAVSDAVADSLVGYSGDRVVIRNGVTCDVDAGAAAAARVELGLGPDDPLVVHVGNIRPGKGHDTLVDAAAVLAAEVPGVRVVSIGTEKFPGDLGRVRARAQELGVEATVSFLGRRPDALAFTAAADVYVNPADHEGLPVAVLEAMCLGRPIVATAVGGVPSVIHDDATGLLVPAGDPATLADAVRALLDDRDRAARLGAAAAAYARAELDLATMVARVEAVYDDVLAARGRN